MLVARGDGLVQGVDQAVAARELEAMVVDAGDRGGQGWKFSAGW